MSLISHRSRRRIGAGVVAAVIALPAVALTANPAFADDGFPDGEYCERWEVTVTTDLETGEVETTRVCEPGSIAEMQTPPDTCLVDGGDGHHDAECYAAHAHQEVPITDGEGQQEWGHTTEEPVDVVAVDEDQDAPAANVPDAEGTDLVAIEH